MAYQKDGPHSTLGPDPKTGGFKKGFLAALDGSDALHTHHEQPHVVRGMEHQAADGSLARTSKAAKLHPDTPTHLGMRSRTSSLPGMLHLTDVHGVPDAVQPNVLDPLAPSQAGKRLNPLRVHDAMNSARQASAMFNGDDVLAEGIAASGPDHPVNMAAKLPESTEEH